jgi:uncharacterized protein DUF1552
MKGSSRGDLRRAPWERRLGRRAFLGGAGALVALPIFESLVGERHALADDSFPMRTVFYYVPDGIVMSGWTPAATGSAWQLTPILQPLAMMKSKVLALSGLANAPARPDGPGDHAGGTSGFLTCAHAFKSETDISLGISIDQVIANAIGDQTRIASMQLGIEGGGSTGGCDSGYSCAYTRNISWAGDAQPLSKATNPQVVYNQIFEGADPAATVEEKEKRKLYRLSVLDYVNEDAKALQQRLTAPDRAKLEEYLNGIFELEQRIQKPAPTCEAPGEPVSDPAYEDHVRIMQDLMILAMQCDSTRVITFMNGNAGSNISFPFLGVSGAHHELSHHGGDPTNLASLQTIDTWEVTMLAEMLQKMDLIQEGTGTLLEHAQVFFSSEIEDGDAHRHSNLPVLLCGGAHDKYTTDRHVHYNPSNQGDGPPIANLFVSMAKAAGVDVASFGDSTGELPQLV